MITAAKTADLSNGTQPAGSVVSKKILDQDRETGLKEAPQVVPVTSDAPVDGLAYLCNRVSGIVDDVLKRCKGLNSVGRHAHGFCTGSSHKLLKSLLE